MPHATGPAPPIVLVQHKSMTRGLFLQAQPVRRKRVAWQFYPPGIIGDGHQGLKHIRRADHNPPTGLDHIIWVLLFGATSRLVNHELPGKTVPRVHMLFEVAKQPACCNIGNRQSAACVAMEHGPPERSGLQ